MSSRPLSFRQHFAKQREFIFKGCSTKFEPVERKDIFGAAHIVEQADGIVDILKNFKSDRSNGVKLGGGAVFYGPPGTGKTMTARYIATQSGARFVNMRQFPVILKSGVHVWQPHDIQNLFNLSEEWARKNERPIVIFIDQFDNWLGIQKSVASQLEIELDGFSGRREEVYFIATAQDDPEKFGGSIFRSGRIETKIAFSLPDRHQQIELLGGFLGRHTHETGINLGNLVYLLVQPSHADFESLVNKSHALASRERRLAKAKGGGKPRKEFAKKASITEDILIKVLLSIALDPATGHTLSPEEERRVALHEVSHYLVARALGLPAQFVSCKPGLYGLGLTLASDNGLVRKNPSVEEIKRHMAVDFAGNEVLEVFGIPPSLDGAADYAAATTLVRELVLTAANRRSHLLKEYGLMYIDEKNGGDSALKVLPEVSGDLRSKTEKEMGLLLRREQSRAKRVIRFFGKALIQSVAEELMRRPNKVILQRELDVLLGSKLRRFWQRNGIKDMMASDR